MTPDVEYPPDGYVVNFDHVSVRSCVVWDVGVCRTASRDINGGMSFD